MVQEMLEFINKHRSYRVIVKNKVSFFMDHDVCLSVSVSM